MKYRTQRVASVLHAKLAYLLLDEVSDPRVQGITLIETKIAADLKSARIYYKRTVLNEFSDKEVALGLKHAAPFLKRRLGKELDLRYTPDLSFEKDEHLDSVSHLMDTLDHLNEPPQNE